MCADPSVIVPDERKGRGEAKGGCPFGAIMLMASVTASAEVDICICLEPDPSAPINKFCAGFDTGLVSDENSMLLSLEQTKQCVTAEAEDLYI